MPGFARFLLIFLALFGAFTLGMQLFGLEYGDADFWDERGVFFLFFITLFPRLTLLFSSVAFGGLFWWLGFIFAPRLLVAVLATVSYWQQNPILVVLSWLVAISGESSEKYVLQERVRIVTRARPGRHYMAGGGAGPTASHTFEGEFHRVDEEP